MIIGYYPGGGGHRYHQYRLGKDFKIPGVAYDGLVGKADIVSRGLYLDQDPVPAFEHGTVLSHCVNYHRLVEVFGLDQEIVIIKSDLKKSLCREWSIKGKNKPMFCPSQNWYEDFVLDLYGAIKDPSWPDIQNLSDFYKSPTYVIEEVQIAIEQNRKFIDNDGIFNFLDAAFSAIVWHHDVYAKYPMDFGHATVVDVDNDQTEFAEIMRSELQLTKNNLFDFAWKVYVEQSRHAKIIDLYLEEVSNG